MKFTLLAIVATALNSSIEKVQRKSHRALESQDEIFDGIRNGNINTRGKGFAIRRGGGFTDGRGGGQANTDVGSRVRRNINSYDDQDSEENEEFNFKGNTTQNETDCVALNILSQKDCFAGAKQFMKCATDKQNVKAFEEFQDQKCKYLADKIARPFNKQFLWAGIQLFRERQHEIGYRFNELEKNNLDKPDWYTKLTEKKQIEGVFNLWKLNCDPSSWKKTECLFKQVNQTEEFINQLDVQFYQFSEKYGEEEFQQHISEKQQDLQNLNDQRTDQFKSFVKRNG